LDEEVFSNTISLFLKEKLCKKLSQLEPEEFLLIMGVKDRFGVELNFFLPLSSFLLLGAVRGAQPTTGIIPKLLRAFCAYPTPRG
jgi:hypothetical protein